MRFVIRFDAWEGDRVTFSVFAGSSLCGTLTMTVRQYQGFVASLLIGAGVTRGVVQVVSDDVDFRALALEAATREGDGEIAVEPSPHVYADMLLGQRRGG